MNTPRGNERTTETSDEDLQLKEMSPSKFINWKTKAKNYDFSYDYVKNIKNKET